LAFGWCNLWTQINLFRVEKFGIEMLIYYKNKEIIYNFLILFLKYVIFKRVMIKFKLAIFYNLISLILGGNRLKQWNWIHLLLCSIPILQTKK